MSIKSYIKKISKSESGIGLVETILSIALAIIVLTALVSLSVFTLRSTTISKSQLQASKLANQELELVRACRDVSASWTDFIAAVTLCFGGTCSMHETDTGGPRCGTAVLYVDTANPEVLGSGLSSITRYFTLEYHNADPDIVKVSVSSTWAVGSASKQTHTYTLISNWQEE